MEYYEAVENEFESIIVDSLGDLDLDKQLASITSAFNRAAARTVPKSKGAKTLIWYSYVSCVTSEEESQKQGSETPSTKSS